MTSAHTAKLIKCTLPCLQLQQGQQVNHISIRCSVLLEISCGNECQHGWIQKCKDSPEKSNVNGSYLAIRQRYFSLGTSNYGCSIGCALWLRCLVRWSVSAQCRSKWNVVAFGMQYIFPDIGDVIINTSISISGLSWLRRQIKIAEAGAIRHI